MDRTIIIFSVKKVSDAKVLPQVCMNVKIINSEAMLKIHKVGLSEPSEPCRFKEARPRFMPPKIERTRLKDMTVSAGEMVKLDANIIGEPPADVTWTRNEEILETTSNKSMTITNVPYNTKLIMRSCKRSDAGEYMILAKNRLVKLLVIFFHHLVLRGHRDRHKPAHRLA